MCQNFPFLQNDAHASRRSLPPVLPPSSPQSHPYDLFPLGLLPSSVWRGLVGLLMSAGRRRYCSSSPADGGQSGGGGGEGRVLHFGRLQCRHLRGIRLLLILHLIRGALRRKGEILVEFGQTALSLTSTSESNRASRKVQLKAVGFDMDAARPANTQGFSAGAGSLWFTFNKKARKRYFLGNIGKKRASKTLEIQRENFSELVNTASTYDCVYAWALLGLNVLRRSPSLLLPLVLHALKHSPSRALRASTVFPRPIPATSPHGRIAAGYLLSEGGGGARVEGEDMEEEEAEEAQTEVLQQQCESCCSHTHGAPATKGELRLGGIMTKGGIEEPSPPLCGNVSLCPSHPVGNLFLRHSYVWGRV